MNNKNKTLAILIMLFLSVTIISSTLFFQDASEPWEVPSKFKSMENPTTADAESLKVGKMQYSKHCASCHGKTGLGDGSKARSLDTSAGDFTSDAYLGQTDGEHFYKSKFGRNEMPKFENKFPDEDIWFIVNYMKTFKK